MKLLKEPLLHFILIGAALFGLQALIRQRPAEIPSRQRIEITGRDIEQLERAWESQQRRPPTDKELDGLIQARVREEILPREALSMGLDRGDDFVRQRLAKKFDSFVDDLTSTTLPKDVELEVFFSSRREKYRDPNSPRLPELAEVKVRVAKDWNDEQRRRVRDESFKQLLRRYEVVIDTPTAQATQSPFLKSTGP